jgi:hypothetical protein
LVLPWLSLFVEACKPTDAAPECHAQSFVTEVAYVAATDLTLFSR